MGPRHLVVLIAAVALGCSDSPATETTWVEETPSGVPWIHNVGPGAWGPAVVTEIRFRLGSIDGPEEETFGSIGDFAILSDGSVAILDTQVQLVRVFDSTGAYLHSFGGRGDGPGEFSYGIGVSSDSQGRIWVSDARRPALHVFSAEGRYLESYPYPPGLAESFVVRDEVFTTVLDSPDRDFSTDQRGSLLRVRPIRVALRSERVDTLSPITIERPVVNNRPVPFSGRIRTAFGSDPSTIWVSDGSDYRIVARQLLGDTTRIVSRDDAVAAPITGAVADSLSYGDAAILAAFPDVYPSIDQLFSDGDGHLFVIPRVEGADASSLLDVFREDDGQYLGQVALPVRPAIYPIPRVRNGVLYSVTRDALGVEYVVSMDLGLPGAPAG